MSERIGAKPDLGASLERLVEDVKAIYSEVDLYGSLGEKAYGTACMKGCSGCCTNPKIEVSPLEWLPLIKEMTEEQMESFYAQAQKKDVCVFLSETPKGGCGIYAFRPLICRLFSQSVMMDKSQSQKHPTFQPCRIKKEHGISSFQDERGLFPNSQSFGMRLRMVEPSRSEYRPINQAFCEAVDWVRNVRPHLVEPHVEGHMLEDFPHQDL